ncbi:hypothetical protein pb186bvf_007976 [Paramecium bursaria]
MLILSMLIIMVFGQYTIYPTINSTFQYPLDKVFEDKGFNYDILEKSQSPFTIQQAIVQGQTSDLPNIGDIIYTSQSQDNFFAALSYQSDFFMASVFQVQHRGELILQMTYVVNASLYTCYNLVLYRNDSVIINCIQHQTNLVTLFSFGQVNTQNITNITIKPDQIQQSAISIQRNTITFSYQFENYIDIYTTYFNQQFILHIQQHQILNGTYLEIYQNRQGVVFALQIESITIYYNNVTIIKAPQNMTFIDFEVQFFNWSQNYITVYLLSGNQIESLHVYQNGTYKYHSQVEFKQEYTKIFVSRDSILLYREQQLAYYKIDEDGSIQYYNYLNKNTKCKNLIYIWGPQVLYCINNQQYTPYQQGAPYLYSKNGVQDKGTLKLITTDIDKFTDIVSVNYNPLELNEQGIYPQYENRQQFKISGRRKFTYLDMSQLIVGSNLTYNYNSTDQPLQKAFVLQAYPYGMSGSALCSIMYSQFSFSWVLACFEDGELRVEIQSQVFMNSRDIVYTQKAQLLAQITQIKVQPYNYYDQQIIQIILHSKNKIYIYYFEEFVALNQQFIIDMSAQSKSIEIQDIQTLNEIIIILTQNPNRVYYTFGRYQVVGPLLLQLDYSREILQIATNPISYFYLLVNQVGQAQVVRFWGRGQGQGYKIIQRIKYPDGYQKCIIGPVSSGIFFYFYTDTQSELYFLQREFIKQIDLQHNMFFTKVDTSNYQLVQIKLSYSFSNQFFYVVCQDKNGNLLLNIYQGSYQAIKILRSSFELFKQPLQLAITVYQYVSKQYGADLILLPSGKGEYSRYLITHKPYLIIVPEFNWQINYQIKVTFAVNNNFTQTQVQSIIIVNQSYLQLTSQPKNLLQQTYKIENKKFNFDVSKMFRGPIQKYELLCDGCEIQQFQLPIDDKFETFQQEELKSYTYKEEEHDGKKTQFFYLLKKDGSLFSLDINTKQEELLVQGKNDKNDECSNLFLEINTNNPSWICQNLLIITFNTYNPSSRKNQFSQIEFKGQVVNSFYTLGYLQLFTFINTKKNSIQYSIIQYNIVKDKQHINILINQQRIDSIFYQLSPIIVDNNSLNPIIGAVGLATNIAQYLIITNIGVNQTLARIYPYPFTSFNTQNTYVYQTFQIGQPERRDNNLFIKFYNSGILNPQIFELKFDIDGAYKEQQSICHLNLLNYTDRQNKYIATSNGKQIVIIQYNPYTTDKYEDFLIYDFDQCGKIKLVNPYQQLKLLLNISIIQVFNYLNDDTLIYQSQDQLALQKSTGKVTGTYKQTEEDSTISVIAQNPVNQASQILEINKSNKQTSQGLAWYWVVLIIISSLVAAFYGYVFIRQKVITRNAPSNQENIYLEMR